MVWQIVGVFGQMLCQSVADGKTTVADVIAICCYLCWQMLCQGVADGITTLLQWQMVWSIVDVFWQTLCESVGDGMPTVANVKPR